MKSFIHKDIRNLYHAMFVINKRRLLGTLLFVGLVFVACQRNEPQHEVSRRIEPAPLAQLPPDVNGRGVSLSNPEGVLILSEGNFGNEAGHLSYVLPGTAIYANGIIKAQNGRYLGSITQDLALGKGRLYILSRNGMSQGEGQMAHISVFDKDFRLIEDYAPDIATDANLQNRPERLAVAHGSLYLYAGGVIYECDTEGSTKGICEIMVELQNPLPERLYTAVRASGEYLYALGRHRVYEVNERADVAHYALPRGYEALAMTLSPKLAGSEDIYAWVLCRASQTGQTHLIKLRNLQQEFILPLSIELGQEKPQKYSLLAVPLKQGALLVFKQQGKVYAFDTEDKKLRILYQSGNAGGNILYGYMGLDPIRGSIYLSEFEDYSKYTTAWVSELALDGRVKQKLPITVRSNRGLATEGIYTPFCAGIYPLSMLYRY